LEKYDRGRLLAFTATFPTEMCNSSICKKCWFPDVGG